MRLLTRSDFDGLICAVLLKELGIMDEWKFVHPKDVQEGLIEVTDNDILANVPYAPGCGLWFDHHSSEQERINFNFEVKGMSYPYPSCARVIWEYYGGQEKFPAKFEEMLKMVDKSDSGNLTAEEITDPPGWLLLSFVMDPRTGLGRYKDYRISNYQLMEKLIDWCRTMPINEILELPDVRERTDRYFKQQELHKGMLRQKTKLYGSLAVVDLRDQEEIYSGNRFMLYALFPECNISITVIWGKNKQNVVFAVGHSILNRTCQIDVGSLLFKYGGGGHKQVGTCQVPVEKADELLDELIAKIQKMNAKS